MKFFHNTLTLATLIAFQLPLFAQVDAGEDVLICEQQTVALTAAVTGIMGTTAYTVASTTWTPETVGGTSIGLSDDAVSAVQPIGFSFCFFGNTYNNFYIGSNGWIGFTAGQPTAFTSQTLPNTGANVPKNCIMGPWQDWHPGTGNNVGNYIKYQTVGTAPNRKLIVTWDNVPMFSCTNNFGKFQIVLFETTNLIRNNLFNKPTCAWAGGNATQGIHNLGGTVAYTVPGRNSANWTATNESWEYVPNGIQWTQNGTPAGNALTINVNPAQTTTYVATVTLCDGTSYSDEVIVQVGSDIDLSNSTVIGTNCSNQIGSIEVVAESNSPGPFTYVWEGIIENSSTLINLDDGVYNLTITDESNGCEYQGVFEVPVASTLQIDVNDIDITCNGANNGQASVTATSDFPGFSYLWSDDLLQTTPEISGLSSGLYSVEVTDADGCSETAIVIISEPSPLEINFSSTPISCPNGADGSITAIPSGGVGNYSLLWEGNLVATSIFDIAEGTYSVTLLDANGCEHIESFSIADPDSISASFTVNQPSCAGIEDGIIAADGLGGTAPYTYFWPFNGSSSNIIDNLTSGEYLVWITDDNNCLDSALVVVDPTLELNIVPAFQLPSCAGADDGAITVVVEGGNPQYTYTWNDPNAQTAANATGLSAGAYTIWVQDANGCQGEIEFILDEPQVLSNSSTLTNPSCAGENSGDIIIIPEGGTVPYSIDWDQNLNGFELNGLGAGVYSFELSDANGCSLNSQINLIEPAALEATFLTANALCYQTATGSIAIDASGGTAPYSYIYSTNTMNAAFNNNLPAGNHTVTIQDANGCSLVLNFNIQQPNALEISVTTEPASCGQSDGSASAAVNGGNSPYVYQWTTINSNSNQFNNVAAGNYSLTVIDSFGCESEASYTIGEIPVQASFITNATEGMTPFEVEFINTSDGANTYTWDFGDGSLPLVTNNSEPVYHTYEDEGFFTTTLYASYNGDCQSLDTLQILAYQVSEISKIPNIFSPNSDGSNSTFRVLSENLRKMEVIIYNRWGKEVGIISSPNGEWSATDVAAGVYYYTLVAEGYDQVKYQMEGSVMIVR
jgi:gliding motility-associated-like protein